MYEFMTERTTAAAASELKQDYQNFMQKAASLFPKVDQKLIVNMLQFENTNSDWEGNVLLKVVYPSGTDMEKSGYTASTSACLPSRRTRQRVSRRYRCT
jgi:hypothetical protein